MKTNTKKELIIFTTIATLIISGVFLAKAVPAVQIGGDKVHKSTTVSSEGTLDYDFDPCSLESVVCEDEALLDAIAFCESSNNYYAQNAHSTAYGKYQIIAATWNEVAKKTGKYDKQNHEHQEINARYLLETRGTRPWNESKACWGSKQALTLR